MKNTSPAAVTTWKQFGEHWAGPCNFRLGEECRPLKFDMPPIDRIIDELSRDEESHIGRGDRGDRLRKEDFREQFLQVPLEKAMELPFTLAHFRLSKFDLPGKFLHGFGDRVLTPWTRALADAGFTFDRCYPIVFISGRHCATNYHMDYSHVLAWQVYGTKHFCGLQDPERWAPRDVRLNYNPGSLSKPEQITSQDELCHTMLPGDALWNVLLTPHWVNAGDDEMAMSINFSHGGLRLHGALSPNEHELEAYRDQHPGESTTEVKGVY